MEGRQALAGRGGRMGGLCAHLWITQNFILGYFFIFSKKICKNLEKGY